MVNNDKRNNKIVWCVKEIQNSMINFDEAKKWGGGYKQETEAT